MRKCHIVFMTVAQVWSYRTFNSLLSALDLAGEAKEVFDTASVTCISFDSADWVVVVLPSNLL